MIVYRASSLGRCLRASVAERLGKPPAPTPPWLQKIFDGGNEHEEACIDAMTADGWAITDQQLEVNLSITDDILVQGHLDGICGKFGGEQPWAVLEVKSPTAWARFQDAYKTADWSDPLCARYAWQISCYMVATGLEAVVACLDGDPVRTFGIEIPPHSLDDIYKRVMTIETGLLDECTQDDSGGCPYRNLPGGLCSIPDIVWDPVLDNMVVQYESVRDEIKVLSDALKIHREEILAHLGERDSVTTDLAKVTRYTSKHTSLDRKAVSAAGIDLAPYEKVTESVALKVTERKAEDEVAE